MVTPTFIIRYTAKTKIDLTCPEKSFYQEKVDSSSICYHAVSINSENEISSNLYENCLDVGGDLLHTVNDVSNICSHLENDATLYYSADYNFWETSHFLPSSSDDLVSNCVSENIAALCVLPLTQNDNGKENKTCARQEPYPVSYPDYYFPESFPGVINNYCPGNFINEEASWECGGDGTWIDSASLM